MNEDSSNIDQVSYEVLQDDETTLQAKAVSRTSNGILEITQILTMDKSSATASIGMTVKNIGSATVSSARIKRVCDLDVDSGGYYGWAGTDNYFGLLSNGIRCYTTSPPSNKDAHRLDFYGEPAPDWFGADGWDDWYQRENTEDVSNSEYPVNGDYAATLSWDIGHYAQQRIGYGYAVYRSDNASPN